MITIDQWFIQHAYRPIALLALCLYLLLFSSVFLLFQKNRSDNLVVIDQSAKHLLLAINQKNRSQVDLIISTLGRLDSVKAVSLCQGDLMIITRNGEAGFCNYKKDGISDVPVIGSKNFFLRVEFKHIILSPIILFSFLFSIVAAAFGYFILRKFKGKFELDLLENIKNISEVEKCNPIHELNEIRKGIHLAQENRNQLEKQKSLTELSLQVSHDIRSPLASLNFIIDNQKAISEFDRSIITKSIGRINDIADDLLGKTRAIKRNEKFDESLEDKRFNVTETVIDIVNEKKIEYSKFDLIEISLSIDTNEELLLETSKNHFSRVISNLINNAVEAMEYKGLVQITIIKSGSLFQLTIKDEGGGVDKNFFENLRIGNNSTKANGNGLGVSNSIKIIETSGGEISFANKDKGLLVTIVFKLGHVIDAILIDNDELCRLTWEIKAISKGLKLLTFPSPMAFSRLKNSIDHQTPIYLDSRLDDDIKGEDFANQLYKDGFSNLILTTGHPAELFSEYTFLSNVISKTPPF